MSSGPALVDASGVVKTYGTVTALSKLDLRVVAGEVSELWPSQTCEAWIGDEG